MKRAYYFKRILRVLIIALILLGLFLLIAPGYVSKALIYQKADIDDYSIFHNRKVKAENPVTWSLSENQAVIPENYQSKIDSMETVAFWVIRNDSILHENYHDGYSDTSLSNAFSATKSIVSLLPGIAIEKGYIKSLDQPVGDFFNHYKKGRNQNLTIRDLLTMSSGLDWDESYGSLFSTTTQAYYGEDLKELVMDLKVVKEPGQQFKYLSGNTQLLALIIAKSSGMTLSEFASKYLWTPIGARHDALWSLDDENGNEKAYCCFNSNARDFARIGKLVLDSGRFRGK